jgi:hypothetical protein
MLQVLRKNFHSDLIKPYYSTLVDCLKRTSNFIVLFYIFSFIVNKMNRILIFDLIGNDKIIYEILNIWNNQEINIDDIKEALLPLIKKVMCFFIYSYLNFNKINLK